MISNLPKWYNLAAITPISEQTLERRSTAINNIIKNKDLSWSLDCVRLYLGKPLKSVQFDAEFAKEFHDVDSMFLAGSEIEKRVLASAILAELINNRHKNSTRLALAIKSGAFGVNFETLVNPEIKDIASDYLNLVSINIRNVSEETTNQAKVPVMPTGTQTVASLTTVVKELVAFIKDNTAATKKTTNLVNSKINVLEEESDIHWWLFRSFSSLGEKPVNKLPASDAAILLAQELSDKLKLLPGPPNLKEFLKKIFSEGTNNEKVVVTLKEVVNLMSNSLLEKINQKPINIYGNLTPLFLGQSKALESGDSNSWASSFTKACNITSDRKFSLIEIADQYITEETLNKI